VTRTGRSALGAALVFAAALLAFVPGIGTREIWTRDEAAKRPEAHIPPEAAVGYLDAHRVISLAVYLSRPLKHLPAPTPPSMPDYVVLLGADFQNLARPWSLERVDEVVIRDSSYVLAHRRAPESLTPGKEADIIILDATALNVAPLNQVQGAVVSLMNRTNVETVIVAGKIRKWLRSN
jgi:hypothetical protein